MEAKQQETKITEIFKGKTEREITNGLWEREKGDKKELRTVGKWKITERNKERITENGLAVRVGTMHILQLGSIAFS